MATATTPAPAKPGSYDVGRPGNHCAGCGQELAPGTPTVAALRETAIGFDRVDLELTCWPGFDRANLIAFWQTTVPHPTARKKLLVDDAVLCELFERLADATEPAKLNFRFVLGLILMRKRLLNYESSHDSNGSDFWTVRLKGRDASLQLLNPRLGEQQVAEVSTQLGDILNETL
jgi:hypothetical protein